MLSDAQIAVYPAPENLLADRVIMITGAGDGIGKVAALHCAQHGATVILAGRTVAKLEQVYDTIVAKGGPEPVIYPIDLEGASSEDYDALCGHIEEQFGRLDGLLHNAGILGQRTPLSNYRTDVWDKVMQVNVTAGFQMTQALMPVLEKSDNASVIFTSSGVGRVILHVFCISAACAAARARVHGKFSSYYSVEGCVIFGFWSMLGESVTRLHEYFFQVFEKFKILGLSTIRP